MTGLSHTFSTTRLTETDMESDSRDEAGFLNSTQVASERSVWTTVVGIGKDLSKTVIDRVSATAGCNYSLVR